MPGIDGLEVLRIVREAHTASDLPIVMATAKDQSEDVVAALELGANDYVTKPIDFRVVLARLQTQLALKRATDDLARAHARMKASLEAAARVQRPCCRPRRRRRIARGSRGDTVHAMSWPATRSTSVRSRTDTCACTCWTSAATVSPRRCSR